MDGTALSVDLAGNGVGLTELVTPVAATDWDDGELGQDDGATDGGGDFLGALDTKTDVAVLVTDGDNSLKRVRYEDFGWSYLEASTLTGTGLLLDWLDLQDLVLEGGANEVIDDLELLDWEGEGVDLLEGGDLSLLDETAELGDWLPLLGFGLAATTALSATSTTTSAAASTATTAETTAESAITLGWCCVRH